MSNYYLSQSWLNPFHRPSFLLQSLLCLSLQIPVYRNPVWSPLQGIHQSNCLGPRTSSNTQLKSAVNHILPQLHLPVAVLAHGQKKAKQNRHSKESPTHMDFNFRQCENIAMFIKNEHKHKYLKNIPLLSIWIWSASLRKDSTPLAPQLLQLSSFPRSRLDVPTFLLQMHLLHSSRTLSFFSFLYLKFSHVCPLPPFLYQQLSREHVEIGNSASRNPIILPQWKHLLRP